MATTYNTGNAIGSADPRDAYDNASNFDEFSNSSAQGFTDRRGVSRKTITGATAGYAAFNVTGAWTTSTAYNVNDVWSDSGTFYLVLTDYTSGASAAADIAGGNVVVHQPKDWVVPIETIADLRAFEPSVANQQIELLGHTNPGVGGDIFWHDASDTTTADDNGVTIVTAGGKRWKRRLNGYVTPEMFGAVGDGVTDEWEELQKSIDIAKILGIDWLLPPSTSGYYRTTGPIFPRSGIDYYFHAQIRNDRPYPPATFGDSFAFMLGAYDNVKYNALTYDTAASISAGDNTVNVGGTAAARYGIGDTVIIRDSASVAPASSAPSDYMRFDVVTDIQSGVLYLRYGHDEDVTGVSVSPADDQVDFYTLATGDVQKCYVLRDANFYGLNVASEGFWTASTATLNCGFHGGVEIDALALWYGNSFQRTTIDSISGRFQRQLFEVASNSYQFVCGPVVANRFGSDTTLINIGLFSENSKDCEIGPIYSNSDSFTRTTPVIAFTNSVNCGVKGGSVSVRGAAGTVVSFSEAVTGASDGNYVDGVKFVCGPAAYLFDMRANGTAVIKNPKLKDCEFEGSDALVGSLARLSLDGYEISGNTFEQDEKITATSAATSGRIFGNEIPGGFSVTSGTIEGFFARNYVSGNATNRNKNIRGLLFRNLLQTTVTSTTSGHVVETLTVNAPSFSNSDINKSHVLVTGKSFGVTGSKTVEVRFAGTLVAQVSHSAATQEAFRVEVNMSFTGSSVNCLVSVTSESAPEVLSRVNITGLDFSVTNYDLELRAWVSAGGDSIVLDNFISSPEFVE